MRVVVAKIGLVCGRSYGASRDAGIVLGSIASTRRSSWIDAAGTVLKPVSFQVVTSPQTFGICKLASFCRSVA